MILWLRPECNLIIVIRVVHAQKLYLSGKCASTVTQELSALYKSQ